MTKARRRDQIRARLHEIIFEADTYGGKLFDTVLLVLILLSVIASSIETIPNMPVQYIYFLDVAEWLFTILFTIEYVTRIYVVLRPMKYITSFFGIVDLMAIIPTYLSIIIAGSESLMIIRALRLLRIFRIFKMSHHLKSSQAIMKSLKVSMPKITVFLYFIFVMVCIFGAIMYLVEGSSNPKFDSIPRSIYWAIVTLTTVGFGDITPTTFLGQFLSAIIMVTGYAIIAVPTGIISADYISSKRESKQSYSTQFCRYCSAEGHDISAVYCKFCGEKLNPTQEEINSE